MKLSEFRAHCKTAHASIQKMKVDADKTIAKYKETYSNSYAKECAEKMLDNLNTEIASITAKLSAELAETINTKRTALEEYANRAPSDEMMRTLQLSQMRGKLSKTELDILIKGAKDSYPAMKFIDELAKANGFYLDFSVDVENELSHLAEAEKYLSNMLKGIASDSPTYQAVEFFSNTDDNNGFMSVYLGNVDNSPAFAEKPAEIPEPTLRERIDERIVELGKEFDKSGNLASGMKAVNLLHFREDNRETLMTPEERRAEDLTALESRFEEIK